MTPERFGLQRARPSRSPAPGWFCEGLNTGIYLYRIVLTAQSDVLNHARFHGYILSWVQALILGLVELSLISSPSLNCVHAVCAWGQRRMLGKIFLTENSSPALSPRPPAAACELRGAESCPPFPGSAAAAPTGSESRILALSSLRFPKGTAGATCGTGQTGEQQRGRQTSSLCHIRRRKFGF